MSVVFAITSEYIFFQEQVVFNYFILMESKANCFVASSVTIRFLPASPKGAASLLHIIERELRKNCSIVQIGEEYTYNFNFFGPVKFVVVDGKFELPSQLNVPNCAFKKLNFLVNKHTKILLLEDEKQTKVSKSNSLAFFSSMQYVLRLNKVAY